MFIENLSEHEIGTLIAALKQFRARRDMAMSCISQSSVGDTVNVLLVKLESLLMTSLASADPALHGLAFNR
jgi:hypothetical protein